MDVVFSVHEQHKRQGQILLYTVYQVVYVYLMHLYAMAAKITPECKISSGIGEE
jgi:hypothetical protein